MPMQMFATVAEYDARFPGRTASDAVLTACLEDATASIIEAIRGRYDPDDLPADVADRCMRVCRAVADRLLPRDSDVPVGITQVQTTAGPYSQMTSYSSSYGLPKLLDSELAMLGVYGGRVGWAQLGGGPDD